MPWLKIFSDCFIEILDSSLILQRSFECEESFYSLWVRFSQCRGSAFLGRGTTNLPLWSDWLHGGPWWISLLELETSFQYDSLSSFPEPFDQVFCWLVNNMMSHNSSSQLTRTGNSVASQNPTKLGFECNRCIRSSHPLGMLEGFVRTHLLQGVYQFYRVVQNLVPLMAHHRGASNLG